MPFRPVFTLKLIALRGGPEWFTEVHRHMSRTPTLRYTQKTQFLIERYTRSSGYIEHLHQCS